MSDVVDLKLARIDRETDNAKVNPLDLLAYAREELTKGRPVRSLLIIAEVEAPNGDGDIERFRAGVTRKEEAGLLALALDIHLKEWVR